MTDYIYGDSVVYKHNKTDWIYFEQDNKLFKARSKKYWQRGKEIFEIKEKKEIFFGTLEQNPQIKKVIIEHGLPIIHHRKTKQFLANINGGINDD